MISSIPPAFAVSQAQHKLAADPAQALANFTWVNNLTEGAGQCRFAYAGDEHCLAQHMALPFTAISVEGHDPDIVRQLACALLEPWQTAFTLAPHTVASVLQGAVAMLDTRPEWQMLFRGDSGRLDPGSARLLTPGDWPAAQALAATDEVMVFGPETFARNQFFGVFAGDELAAMGGVQTRLPGLCEIGSIVTHPQRRRQGYATQIVAALIHHLQAQNQQTFLCLFQSNTVARLLYEKLGFEIVNELALLSWRLP